MASFNYIALDKSGVEKKGVMESESRTRVLEDLRSKGLMPVEVTEQNLLNKDLNIGFLSKKPTPRDMSVFCHQFVSILDAGVPVVSALDMLSKQTDNKVLRNAVEEARRGIEKGGTLSDSMRPNVKVFTPLLITLVEAGETSGTLSLSFARMAVQFERSAKVKAMVRKATIYPAVIGVVAVIMIIVMLTVVLPSFQSLFEDLGTELPGITVAIMSASDFLIEHGLLIALVAGGAITAIIFFRRSDAGHRFFSWAAKTLPVTKDFSVKSGAAGMARTLSTLFSSGIPLIDSLEITARTLNNVYFKEAVHTVRDDVAVGISMSESLERTAVFPPMVHQMTHIGEETGNIEAMLDKLASYYEEETEAASAALAALMEPAIVAVMAIIVAVLVISMVAPMGAMYSALDSL